MPSLRDVQQSFVAALLSGDTSGIAPQIMAEGIAPEQRVQIYRNNTREGFTATLALTFPVIERLGGADWFRQSAWRYQQRHPSRCGDLQYVGERFADFLATELHGTPYEFFIDVARLEWAYQEVLIAASVATLDMRRLSEVAQDEYDRLHFELRPEVRCVTSPFPILAIWKSNCVVDDEVPIDLQAGPSRVLLIRREDHVELREISEAEAHLLRAIEADASLGELASLSAARFADIDFSATLVKLAQREVFADFRIDHP